MVVRALELFEAEVVEAHTEDGEPVRGEAGRKVWEMAEAIDASHKAGRHDRMDHVFRFLGYIASRLDDLELRLSPEDGKTALSKHVHDHHTRTALRPDTPEGMLLHKISSRLDRIEGRKPPGTEQDRPGMSCIRAGCRDGWIPAGGDRCNECGGVVARL